MVFIVAMIISVIFQLYGKKYAESEIYTETVDGIKFKQTIRMYTFAHMCIKNKRVEQEWEREH